MSPAVTSHTAPCSPVPRQRAPRGAGSTLGGLGTEEIAPALIAFALSEDLVPTSDEAPMIPGHLARDGHEVGLGRTLDVCQRVAATHAAAVGGEACGTHRPLARRTEQEVHEG